MPLYNKPVYGKILDKSYYGRRIMIKHPDGENMTRELIALAPLNPNSHILDMGAGDGEAVELLRLMGYEAFGIDRIAAENVTAGDMTALPFEDECFDAVIAECSFSVCGDTEKAFDEAYRVLKPNGFLFLSDVYFKSENAPNLSLKTPAVKEGWIRAADAFELIEFHDRTKQWTEFIIHCIWNGLDLGDCGFYKSAAKAKAGYFLSLWKKEL